MLTLTAQDAIETMRARVNILLQAILVAIHICVPHDSDPEVWFTLPIHPGQWRIKSSTV